MAIADLAGFNSQTHGDSSPQRSGLTVAQARGRPQTAPSARGSSPGRPRSAGSVSPDRGLKVLLSVPCIGFLQKCVQGGTCYMGRSCSLGRDTKEMEDFSILNETNPEESQTDYSQCDFAMHACSAFCPSIVQKLMHVLSVLSNAGVSLLLCIWCMLNSKTYQVVWQSLFHLIE